jgi:hypothetical protein
LLRYRHCKRTQATLANDKQHAIEAQGQCGTALRIPAADNAPLDAGLVRVRRLHDTFREALQPDRIDLARDTAATFGQFHRVEARRRLLHHVTLHRPPPITQGRQSGQRRRRDAYAIACDRCGELNVA